MDAFERQPESKRERHYLRLEPDHRGRHERRTGRALPIHRHGGREQALRRHPVLQHPVYRRVGLGHERRVQRLPGLHGRHRLQRARAGQGLLRLPVPSPRRGQSHSETDRAGVLDEDFESLGRLRGWSCLSEAKYGEPGGLVWVSVFHVLRKPAGHGCFVRSHLAVE